MKDNIKTWVLSLAGLAVIVYIVGALFIDVMNIDSSHYAEMSREMAETGNYLVIKNRTVDDYLDKPPLIFWISSLCFTLFGVSTFTFRIPALLLTMLGAYSVYRFTRMYYDKETGILAMLILLSSQVSFLYNQNFLTDTLLANLTMFSIWQLAAYLRTRHWLFFLGAFCGLALAMMSKGPLGLMVPVAGFSIHFLYKGQWRNFIRWEWVAGGLLILLLLSPMMWGLYRQFGMTGLQFFFWTQSFGRLTGQSHWHDQSSYFYFVHTFSWFMLPWTFLAIYALVRNLRHMLYPPKQGKLPEAVSIGGFILSFIALSLSKYKLPQYIFVIIPLASIFTAPVVIDLLREPSRKVKKWLTGAGYGLSAVYWLGLSGLLIFTFPENSALSWILLSAGIVIFGYFIYLPRLKSYNLVLPVAATAIFVNLILNLHFYPNLMFYQTGNRIAAEWKAINERSDRKLYYLQYHSPALDFHLREAPPVINERKLMRLMEMQQETWVVTDQRGKESLEESWIAEEKPFSRYPVQALTMEFLNKASRQDKLSNDYLIRLTRIP